MADEGPEGPGGADHRPDGRSAVPDVPPDLAEETAEVLEDLRDDKRQVILQAIQYQWTERGPYPPPAMLREYDVIHPGAAQQIFEMGRGVQTLAMTWSERSSPGLNEEQTGGSGSVRHSQLSYSGALSGSVRQASRLLPPFSVALTSPASPLSSSSAE